MMAAADGSDQRDVVRLLGQDAARTGSGPFSLLGVDPALSTPPRVEAALQRQLDRLGQHPESDTLAADGVRLALHEAAQTLLDPDRRRAAIDEHARRLLAAEAAGPAGAAGKRRGRDDDDRPASHAGGSDALVTRMFVVGGAAVLAMLAILVVGALLLTGRGGKPPAPAATATTSPVPTPPVQSDGAVPPTPPVATGEASPPAPAAEPPPTTPAPVVAQRPRSEFTNPALIVRELRTAGELMKSDPDKALAAFERAFLIAGDWWCRFDTAQVRAAGDAVLEFVYRAAARPEHGPRTVAIIADGGRALRPGPNPIAADRVWPAAWSAGMLARLYRERDLPATLTSAVAQAMTGALDDARPTGAASAGFDAGATAAMVRLPAAILAGKPREADEKAAADAMARWVEGVTLWSGKDGAARERLLTAGLGWVLINGREPEADARVFSAVTLLASEIKWLPGGTARPALMEWFRDPRVSPSDLRALTASLSTRSGAEGVDSGMALSMSASADDREALRRRYAEGWDLAEASARADAARDWLAATTAGLAADIPGDDPQAQLALAAALARLSTAAATIWRGGAVPAPIAFEPPSGLPSSTALPTSGTQTFHFGPATATGGGAATGNGRDGAWAGNYFAAERNIPVRLERLKDLESAGTPIGPIDAGVLAQAACFESPVQVRMEAQRVVLDFLSEPAMVAALLDTLPLAPRQPSVSDTFAAVGGVTLPRPSDPEWELRARRALVERLLGMLASTGMHGDTEAHSAAIAEAYLGAVGAEPDAQATGAEAAADAAVNAAVQLQDTLRREAGSAPVTRSVRFSLEAIDRRRTQRRAQAIGPVQAFASEQAGLADVLGYLAAAERPASEPLIAAVLDEAGARRRQARHVFAQVLTNERALLKLWLIRFGEGATP